MARKRDGVWTWIHADHLHSAAVITAENGNEVRRFAYRAFGEEVQNTGAGDAPPYTYTGKELDRTGLYYYGARYYDPMLCRFITPDTLYDQGQQGLNRYSYALNNPILYRDPTGHFINGPDDEASPDCDGCVTGPANNLRYHENFRDPDSLHFQSPFISEHRCPWRIATLPDGDGAIVTSVPGHARPRWEAGWGYQPTMWRTNFISRYVGEVIMALPFTDNEHNIITGEQYDPGPAFDARFNVYLDVALGGLFKAVSVASKTAVVVDGIIDHVDDVTSLVPYNRYVIGTTDDLHRPGVVKSWEQTLEPWIKRDAKHISELWDSNRDVLLKAAMSGQPIRDASPVIKRTGFIDEERKFLEHVLKWTNQKVGKDVFWIPPLQ